MSTGLIVFVVAITGCFYAFQKEIQDITEPYRFVAVQNKTKLSPSEIKAIAEKALGGKQARSVTYVEGRSALVLFHHSKPDYYYHVFVNPYSGKVLKIKNMDQDFFNLVLKGHFYLWLPPSIGHPVTVYGTLLFAVLILSGLVLWWPKSKKGFKQRFGIRWDLSWKRRTYDLHNIPGFYISSLVLVIAFTGLIWGFEWFGKAVYRATSRGKELVNRYEPFSDTTKSGNLLSRPAVDLVWEKMNNENPSAYSVQIYFPGKRKNAVIAVINPDAVTHWKREFRYFDQYTLKEMEVNHVWGKFKNAEFADKVARLNYDVHAGGIGGLPGKVLAFFISLITASLPVTGFLIWRGRNRKISAGNRADNLVTSPSFSITS